MDRLQLWLPWSVKRRFHLELHGVRVLACTRLNPPTQRWREHAAAAEREQELARQAKLRQVDTVLWGEAPGAARGLALWICPMGRLLWRLGSAVTPVLGRLEVSWEEVQLIVASGTAGGGSAGERAGGGCLGAGSASSAHDGGCGAGWEGPWWARVCGGCVGILDKEMQQILGPQPPATGAPVHLQLGHLST